MIANRFFPRFRSILLIIPVSVSVRGAIILRYINRNLSYLFVLDG